MDQLLLVAKNISTLLLPLVLILLILISFLVFKLLLTINKTAGAVKETTFMVNSIVQNSVGGIAQFVMSLFEQKKGK